jgi:hypothetical protein
MIVLPVLYITIIFNFPLVDVWHAISVSVF